MGNIMGKTNSGTKKPTKLTSNIEHRTSNIEPDFDNKIEIAEIPCECDEEKAAPVGFGLFRPSILEIIYAVQAHYRLPKGDNFKSWGKSNNLLQLKIVCYLARQFYYTNTEVAGVIIKDRTTILWHAVDVHYWCMFYKTVANDVFELALSLFDTVRERIVVNGFFGKENPFLSAYKN
jgi:hypothetical protein